MRTDAEAGSLKYEKIQETAYRRVSEGQPAFWRATVKVGQPGDCFLDMHPWGKGFVWVNGHNLGRYWNIGPQQTMYVPGPWLKAGDNEILILDLLAPENRWWRRWIIRFSNELRPELDFARSQVGVRVKRTRTNFAGSACLCREFRSGDRLICRKFDCRRRRVAAISASRRSMPTTGNHSHGGGGARTARFRLPIR